MQVCIHSCVRALCCHRVCICVRSHGQYLHIKHPIVLCVRVCPHGCEDCDAGQDKQGCKAGLRCGSNNCAKFHNLFRSKIPSGADCCEPDPSKTTGSAKTTAGGPGNTAATTTAQTATKKMWYCAARITGKSVKVIKKSYSLQEAQKPLGVGMWFRQQAIIPMSGKVVNVGGLISLGGDPHALVR